MNWMIQGPAINPANEAPPTVKVLVFPSTQKAINFDAGMQIARTIVRMARAPATGTDSEPMRMKKRTAAKR